jgi:hypothetical protein
MVDQASQLGLSFSLVRKELEATLSQAESHFAYVAEEGASSQYLKLFYDEINLARGTFKLLELTGGEVLASEMQDLLAEIKKAPPESFNEDFVSHLGGAIYTLKRYLEFVGKNDRDLPILLIPAINAVRKLKHAQPFPDAHFFTIELKPDLPTPAPSADATNVSQQAPRWRMMYQVALLKLLNSQQIGASGKLVMRSVERFEKAMRGTPAWPFWWVTNAALHALFSEGYELTQNRKRIFSRVDQQIRTLINEGAESFAAKVQDTLVRELLLLVSLSPKREGDVGAVAQAYDLPRNISEKDLREYRRMMTGPELSAFESLATALEEEIGVVKDLLDSVERGEASSEAFNKIEEALGRVSEVLKVVALNNSARKVKTQSDAIMQVKDMVDEERDSSLNTLADALLIIENEVDLVRHVDVHGKPDHKPVTGAHAQAVHIVYDEIRSGLALAKRAVSSYVDSGDRLHLANIKTTLEAVAGGFYFGGEEKVFSLVKGCIRYIEEKLLAKDAPKPDAHQLEVLADALTSIEYYVETLISVDHASDDILRVAVDSLQELGYPIS